MSLHPTARNVHHQIDPTDYLFNKELPPKNRTYRSVRPMSVFSEDYEAKVANWRSCGSRSIDYPGLEIPVRELDDRTET